MRGLRTIRAFAAAGLAGALLLLLTTPPCAPGVCSMDDGAMAACHPLSSNCCHTQGERTAPSPFLAMPLAPIASPPGSVVATAAERGALPEASLEELAPPAILQGIGLHAFLAVFLI